MYQDEIIEEIYKNREEYAKSFNYDLEAIYQDLRQKQASSSHNFANTPIRRKKDEQATFRLILNKFNRSICRGSNQIADSLSMEIDDIEYNLNLMNDYGLIELLTSQNRGARKAYAIKGITPKGKQFLKGKIDLDNHSQNPLVNDHQVKILQAIQNGANNEKGILQEIQIDDFSLNYYLDELIKSDCIKGSKAFNRMGNLEYKRVYLTNKGKVAANNPEDLVEENRGYSIRNISTQNYNENINKDVIQQSHYGNGDNISGKKNITYANHNPELDKIISEIQELLKKQEEEFNPTKEKGKQRIITATIQEIEDNTNLAQRILKASEKGLIAYLQARFISPVQSAFLAALEDWQKTKK